MILTPADFVFKTKEYDPQLIHLFRFQPAHYEYAKFEQGDLTFHIIRHTADPMNFEEGVPEMTTYRLNTAFESKGVYANPSTDGSYTYDVPATTPFEDVFENLIGPSLMGDADNRRWHRGIVTSST